jgi:hypothetical protein
MSFVHPLRRAAAELKLGRRSRSVERVKVNIRDFVDIERAARYIAERRAANEPVVTEKPVVDFSLLVRVWEMFLNDRLGDCTCASVAHGRMIFAALIGEAIKISNAEIERMYEASGWRPGHPNTDQGWTLVDAAGYARTKGLLGTPDIDAYAEVSVGDDDAQQVAMELFAGLSSGCEVPQSAMTQFQEGKPWTPVKGSPIEGGHAIWKAKSELRKSGVFVTWGALQPAVEAWEKEYVDEYLAFVPHAWEKKLPAELVAAGIVDFAKLRSLVTQYTS